MQHISQEKRACQQARYRAEAAKVSFSVNEFFHETADYHTAGW